MDNIILSGMLKDFAKRNDLEDESVQDQFEKFANYCLLRADHYDSFDFDKVGTADSIGVDGAAVAIGGVIVDEVDDARQLTQGQFDAVFYFVQAKTSTKFDLGGFLKFISTVKVFFAKDANSVPAPLASAFEIKELIYERAAKLRALPRVELAYVYSGRFDLESTHLQPQIETEVATLRIMPYLFSEVTWHVHDGDGIARLYREAQNETHREMSFQRHVALPAIAGANAAYLGVVRCKDYVSMIQKGNGDLNRSLFFENVRDFLGTSNPVNEEIARTINNTDESDRFAILNNGVTIVAKQVTPSGDLFKLSAFQVVNGCQTSHVLFNHRQKLTDEMYLTVKLIETSDVDLSGQVIATTNSQSQVTKEAFATIRPYHRVLEDFFNAMRGAGYSYYYERRPHQYDDRSEIKHSQIVSAPSLIKSFVSVVLEEPHKVHYYYGTLLSEYNRNKQSELFSEGDYPGLYFAGHHISSLARQRAYRDRNQSSWAYQLALLTKLQIAPELKKGNQLTDKRFLEMLRRIDSEFNTAYDRGWSIIKRLKLPPKSNRVPDATLRMVSELLREVGRQRPRAEAATQVEPTQRASSPAAFQDGLYSCVVESVEPERSVAVIRYGPFTIEATFNPPVPAIIKKGSRLPFNILNGRATLYQVNQ